MDKTFGGFLRAFQQGEETERIFAVWTSEQRPGRRGAERQRGSNKVV